MEVVQNVVTYWKEQSRNEKKSGIRIADAASEMTASYTRQEVSFDPQNKDSDILTFKLEVPDLNPQDDYAIRAHIDLDRDGKISIGDYINMQSYPPLTRGHPREVSILVRQLN